MRGKLSGDIQSCHSEKQDVKQERDNAMIKVTVIVPVYNNESYIRECLGSIMKQTMKELEILVVNDGSTDGTLDIIQELVEKDSRIIIYDMQNSGYGKAVNLGISHAQGEYIGIVESDDYIAPEMYEELYIAAKKAIWIQLKKIFTNYQDNGF